MLANTIQKQYDVIRSQCAIVTACDAKHAPYLFNAIASFDDRFPDRPPIIVFDIGMSRLQCLELKAISGVELRAVPEFVPHWRLNWSWKLYALTTVSARYMLYLDLANFVIQRSLAPWFVSIAKCGYLVVSNGQTLGEITPEDYWTLHGLDADTMRTEPTFGAGVIGFDRTAAAFTAIERALERVRQGLNLGRSENEKSRNYQPNILRDCKCFRADQTLLNLAFREVFGVGLQVRRAARYSGQGGPNDHPSQYLWYARRNNASLVYVFARPSSLDALYIVNRTIWKVKLIFVGLIKSGLSWLRKNERI